MQRPAAPELAEVGNAGRRPDQDRVNRIEILKFRYRRAGRAADGNVVRPAQQLQPRRPWRLRPPRALKRADSPRGNSGRARLNSARSFHVAGKASIPLAGWGGPFDNLADFVNVERLGNDLIEILAVFLVRQKPFDIRRYGDQPRAGIAIPLTAVLLRDAEAVQLGKAEVDQGDVVRRPIQRRKRLFTVIGDIDLVAPLHQDQFQQILRNRAVFRH